LVVLQTLTLLPRLIEMLQKKGTKIYVSFVPSVSVVMVSNIILRSRLRGFLG